MVQWSSLTKPLSGLRPIGGSLTVTDRLLVSACRHIHDALAGIAWPEIRDRSRRNPSKQRLCRDASLRFCCVAALRRCIAVVHLYANIAYTANKRRTRANSQQRTARAKHSPCHQTDKHAWDSAMERTLLQLDREVGAFREPIVPVLMLLRKVQGGELSVEPPCGGIVGMGCQLRSWEAA